nr:MAG TPA: hypothetical protein [Caudoviricetes sp.]
MLAEYIVRSALVRGGIDTNQGTNSDWGPYDLDDPIITSTGKPARIEIKSAAFVQTRYAKQPNKATFNISPAKIPNENGDYPEDAEKQRNNYLYVFTLYTATDRKSNILDLSLLKFFILLTYKIEAKEKLRNQKTISLKRVKELCKEVSFDELYDLIIKERNDIPCKQG